MKNYIYDVDLHFNYGWDTYQVIADCVDKAKCKALTRVINEISKDQLETLDCIRVFEHNTDKLLKEYNI